MIWKDEALLDAIEEVYPPFNSIRLARLSR